MWGGGGLGEPLQIWVFPKIRVPQNGWYIMENPIKMDDLGGKPTIFGTPHMLRLLSPFEEEEDKAKIQKELSILTDRCLASWNGSFSFNRQSKVVSTHLWNTHLSLYQQVVKGILS